MSADPTTAADGQADDTDDFFTPEASKSLPDWFPAWARELADLYFSGSTCVFILHGNVNDLIRHEDSDGEAGYCTLVDFLGENLFGSWDMVLRHDLSNGLRALAGSDADRHQEMMRYLTTLMGPHQKWSRSPDDILLTLDQLLERNLLNESEKRKSYGLVFEYAQYLVPASDIESLAGQRGARLVRFLQWAQNPYIKKVNIAFCLIADSLTEINDRLVQSPHVATIEVPMPENETRQKFVEHFDETEDLTKITDFKAGPLAQLANGLSLVNVNILLQKAKRSGRKIDGERFGQLKKKAIERQCQGLLEFIEPNHTLDLVVGHDAAKGRLRQDAEFIMNGRLDASPMGYLFCGPVGTGKTFLAECFAGSIGIPCVKLRNFRSKYVGETEGNLERVLGVLRSLGPVVVMIDEADAALGNRTSGGDSGTSARVFSMIASQMGNTEYRGRIIWMLMTCRPDLLPIDLKRQGRAEVHIPLFYPRNEDEVKKMFVVMARKNKIKLADDAVPTVTKERNLSGADIEGIVLSAKRQTVLRGESELNQKDLQESVDAFIPSSQGLEKEMQEVAAVLECTQRDFLTDQWTKVLENPQGRSQLQNRLVSLRGLIDGQ